MIVALQMRWDMSPELTQETHNTNHHTHTEHLKREFRICLRQVLAELRKDKRYSYFAFPGKCVRAFTITIPSPHHR